MMVMLIFFCKNVGFVDFLWPKSTFLLSSGYGMVKCFEANLTFVLCVSNKFGFMTPGFVV